MPDKKKSVQPTEVVSESLSHAGAIEPPYRFTLAELLATISRDNLHSESATGVAVGEEIF